MKIIDVSQEVVKGVTGLEARLDRLEAVVKVLCRALAGGIHARHCGPDYMDIECVYCGVQCDFRHELPHKPDCPVLVAKTYPGGSP